MLENHEVESIHRTAMSECIAYSISCLFAMSRKKKLLVFFFTGKLTAVSRKLDILNLKLDSLLPETFFFYLLQ